MRLRPTTITGILLWASLAPAAWSSAQTAQAREVFNATATVTTGGGATATVPVTLTVDRRLSQAEADAVVAAFKAGGTAGLRKALQGVKPTGSVRLGTGTPTETRITIERQTDKGRLLTVVTDRPLAFVGAAKPDAKPREGYDLAVIDLEVDAKGSGSGTMAPAAKVTIKDGVFSVADYGAELVRLTGVSKAK
jgi:hypothetical protein